MRTKMLAAIGVAALVLVACGADTEEQDAVDDGNGEVGAVDESDTDDDAEPADIEQISMSAATLYGPEQWQSTPLAAYADALAEASGGNVEVEFYYGDALLPPGELATGLADGIADIAYFVHVYTPADFPIDDWISKLGFVADSRPVVGPLQALAATLEWGFQEEEYLEELDNNGLAPLLPRFSIIHSYDLLCNDPVTNADEAAGKRVRIGGQAWADAGQNLGMEPVSLAGGEVYEGFERGIVDCFMGGPPDMTGLGLWDVGDHYTESGFTGFTSYSVSVGKGKWDSLSTEAQQLMWDNLRVYLDRLMTNYLEEFHLFFSGGAERGIEFHQMDEATQQMIEDHQTDVRDGLADAAPEQVSDPEASIANYEQLHDKWLDRVLDLGYDPEAASWAEWVENNPDGVDVDLDPWLDAVVDEILGPVRP
jgi:TRAP-type C4-dicarboxylate transport system substrate-binding protein